MACLSPPTGSNSSPAFPGEVTVHPAAHQYVPLRLTASTAELGSGIWFDRAGLSAPGFEVELADAADGSRRPGVFGGDPPLRSIPPLLATTWPTLQASDASSAVLRTLASGCLRALLTRSEQMNDAACLPCTAAVVCFGPGVGSALAQAVASAAREMLRCPVGVMWDATAMAGWGLSDSETFVRVAAEQGLRVGLRVGEERLRVRCTFEESEASLATEPDAPDAPVEEREVNVGCAGWTPRDIAVGAAWWAFGLRQPHKCRDRTCIRPEVASRAPAPSLPLYEVLPQAVDSIGGAASLRWFGQSLAGPVTPDPAPLRVAGRLPWARGLVPLAELILPPERLQAWKGKFGLLVWMQEDGAGEVRVLVPQSASQMTQAFDPPLGIEPEASLELLPTGEELESAFVHEPLLPETDWRECPKVGSLSPLVPRPDALVSNGRDGVMVPVARFGSVSRLMTEATGGSVRLGLTMQGEHLGPVGPVQCVEVIQGAAGTPTNWTIAQRRDSGRSNGTADRVAISGSVRSLNGYGLEGTLRFESADAALPIPIAVVQRDSGKGRSLAPAGVTVGSSNIVVAGRHCGTFSLRNTGPSALSLQLAVSRGLGLFRPVPRILKPGEVWETEVVRRTTVNVECIAGLTPIVITGAATPVGESGLAQGEPQAIEVRPTFSETASAAMVIVTIQQPPPTLELSTAAPPGMWSIPVRTTHDRPLDLTLAVPEGKPWNAVLAPLHTEGEAVRDATVTPLRPALDLLLAFGGDMARVPVAFTLQAGDFQIALRAQAQLTGVVSAQRKCRVQLRAGTPTVLPVDLLTNGVDPSSITARCGKNTLPFRLAAVLSEDLPRLPWGETETPESGMLSGKVLEANAARTVRRWLVLHAPESRGWENGSGKTVIDLCDPAGSVLDSLVLNCTLAPWVPSCGLTIQDSVRVNGCDMIPFEVLVTNDNPLRALYVQPISVVVTPHGPLGPIARLAAPRVEMAAPTQPKLVIPPSGELLQRGRLHWEPGLLGRLSFASLLRAKFEVTIRWLEDGRAGEPSRRTERHNKRFARTARRWWRPR